MRLEKELKRVGGATLTNDSKSFSFTLHTSLIKWKIITLLNILHGLSEENRRRRILRSMDEWIDREMDICTYGLILM